MSRQRRPSAAELALWQSVMAGTAPLGERRAAAPPEAAEVPPAAPSPTIHRRPLALPRPYARALDPQRPVDFDRRTWLRLKRGRVEIERRLDLHGQTQAQAHRRLQAFVAEAAAAGCRCVLIVTGKGPETGGTLRHMVPRWLNEEPNRARVVAFTPAQPRDGGTGALYVLLRRRRVGG
jgi:DNA-nicking Smr family endonuclease